MSEHETAEKIRWRLLRRLLPGWYRRAYAEELLQLHIDRAQGRLGGRFWLKLTGDVLLTTLQTRGRKLTGERPAGERGVMTLELAGHHLRLALRGLLSAPGFTLAVLGTLALGIGANATIFAVLDRLLLSPPEHVVDHANVRRLSVFGVSPFTQQEAFNAALSYPDFRDLLRTSGFAAIAGHSASTITMGRGPASRRVSAELATASYFPLLGVRPEVGRFFSEEEDRIGAAQPAVVLSHGFWQREFGGRPDVLGHDIELGKGRYTVIGVAPRGFTGVDVKPIDLWLPLHTAEAIEAGTQWEDARRWYWFTAVVRLRPDVAEAAAFAEATSHYRAGRGETDARARTARVVAGPLIAARGRDPSREARVTQALAAVALLMLIIAYANVSNLFLVRGVKRRKQLAVQSALGMGRSRMFLLLITEALLLACAAGAISFLIAETIGPLLFRTLLPESTPAASGSLRVLAATLLLTLAATLFTGVIPSLRACRVDLMEVLRSSKGSTRTSWLRRGLSALQAALSVILLVGAGLFVRSLREARSIDLGLDLNTVAVQVELADGSRFGEALAPAVSAALPRVRAHPQVASAATTSLMPFAGVWGLSLELPGPDTLVAGLDGPFFYAAGADYFRTLGIPIQRGRALTDADDAASAPPVAVVNEAMARAVWRGADPLGKCFYVNPNAEAGRLCTTVVGVAGDVLPSVTASGARQLYYLPPRHRTIGFDAGQMLLIRTRGPARDAIPSIVQAIRSAAPDIRYVDAATLQDRLAPELRSWRLGATLLSVFGLLALLVAAAGLYSLLAFDVAQRRFELGVRAALGASSPRLVRAVSVDMLLVTSAGVALGLIAALALARLAEQMLFRVHATDPVVYSSSALTMLVIALAASAWPSWRATRVDPKSALQEE